MNEYAEFIWLRSEIQSLLIEQPIYEIFGSDAVIGSIKPRLKRQNDFFVVIADALKRCNYDFSRRSRSFSGGSGFEK